MRGNMQGMMKQMQKMQKEMEKAAEDLAKKEIEGTAGGNMVKVTVNGNKELTKVTLERDVVDPDDIEMLQDLILTATNDAIKRVDTMSQETMGKFTKGLNIPPGLL